VPPSALRQGGGAGSKAAHHQVRARPSEHFHGQIAKETGQARGVIAGIADDEDVAVALAPPLLRDQVRYAAAQLEGGGLGDLVGGAESDSVWELARQPPAGEQ